MHRGGDWKTGGFCHLETLPDLLSPQESLRNSFEYTTFIHALSQLSNKSKARNMSLLNVTGMTSRRRDGHLSLYYLGPKVGPVSPHKQDCSHWCLPGVPDSWNELLYAILLKQELAQEKISKSTSQSAEWQQRGHLNYVNMFPPTFKCCTIPVPLQLTTIRNCTLERKLEPEQSKCPMLIVSNECAILRDQFESKRTSSHLVTFIIELFSWVLFSLSALRSKI